MPVITGMLRPRFGVILARERLHVQIVLKKVGALGLYCTCAECVLRCEDTAFSARARISHI